VLTLFRKRLDRPAAADRACVPTGSIQQHARDRKHRGGSTRDTGAPETPSPVNALAECYRVCTWMHWRFPSINAFESSPLASMNAQRDVKGLEVGFAHLFVACRCRDVPETAPCCQSGALVSPSAIDNCAWGTQPWSFSWTSDPEASNLDRPHRPGAAGTASSTVKR